MCRTFDKAHNEKLYDKLTININNFLSLNSHKSCINLITSVK